ncbi:DUF948 domain-containing protein [Paenibacillus methanolicus]|uniref:Uncharacterized protein YoxC n=1 Tax=Paenibacillus methanolicus TaxID=582686 RepID=A0A5S5C6A1_9BACL|nr:DUF948 domain-containing protein [Paenibacillus methanolicus]TYP73916.1 uncharacterized protein YoxC [Paenibacillus methanolicus]
MIHIWFQACIAIAFVVLVAGVLLWLRSADRKLGRLVESAKAIERSAAEITVKAGGVADPAAEAIRAVHRQIDSAARLFEAARIIGDSADQAAAAVRKMTGVFTDHAASQVERGGGKYKHQIKEALDWAEVGYAAWQFVQSKRSEERSSACYPGEFGHDTKEPKPEAATL